MTAEEMKAKCEAIWLDLVEKSDRTSPAENPDMALITFPELKDYLQEIAAALTATEPKT